MHPSGMAATASDAIDWWTARGESVEPPNQRRDGESGVERLQTGEGFVYIKRQRNHLYRSWLHPLGYPTAMREHEAMCALKQIGIPVPEPVFAEARRGADGWQAVLVTRALAGQVDLEYWYQKRGRQVLGEETHAALLRRLGNLLGLMHRHRWQHTCLYPKHIFATLPVAGELPQLALLDLEKARRRFPASRAARRDLAQLRRHSSMWNDTDWQHILAGHRDTFQD